MPDTGTAPHTIQSVESLPSRGIHHLALTTEDMQMTTDFYVNVVGMPLVHAMKVPPGVGTGPGNRGNPGHRTIANFPQVRARRRREASKLSHQSPRAAGRSREFGGTARR